MNNSPDRVAVDGATTGERSAAVLRRDRARVAQAQRLRTGVGATSALDRIAALASHLLGTAAGQVSLLEDVQIIAGGSGLPSGAVGAVSPLEESLCTVTAAGSGPLVLGDATADRG